MRPARASAIAIRRPVCEHVVARADDLRTTWPCASCASIALLALLEQRDVAIDEPRQRQREHGRLEQRDGGARARSSVSSLAPRSSANSRISSISARCSVRCAGSTSASSASVAQRRLERAGLRERRAQRRSSSACCGARPRADRPADRRCHSAASSNTSALGDERLILGERVVDPARERVARSCARSASRAAPGGSTHSWSIAWSRSVSSRELERRVGKARERARASRAPQPTIATSEQRRSATLTRTTIASSCRYDRVWCPT